MNRLNYVLIAITAVLTVTVVVMGAGLSEAGDTNEENLAAIADQLDATADSMDATADRMDATADNYETAAEEFEYVAGTTFSDTEHWNQRATQYYNLAESERKAADELRDEAEKLRDEADRIRSSQEG